MKFNLKNKELKKTIYFLMVLFGIFGLTVVSLSLVGFVPRNLKIENIITDDDLPKNTVERLPDQITKPERVIIEKINIDVAVLQPDSVNVAVLDESLKKGAVYYPGSGTIEKGNIFIFGHSTNWPIVQNPAYKTFNNLNKLENGDEIILESNNQNFSYLVRSVELVDADNAFVDFDNSGQFLTLSTCNTFGAKQERWVVVAEKI